MAPHRSAAGLAIAAVLVTACSTAPSTSPPVDVPSSAAGASSAACDQFTNALDRTVTQFAYLKVAVGSDIDETDRLATLLDYTGTLAEGAATCAPEATDSLAQLRDETVALAEAYAPNADGAVAEGIYGILVDIRATGEQAWTQMGRPTGGWKELPLHEDGSTF